MERADSCRGWRDDDLRDLPLTAYPEAALLCEVIGITVRFGR